MLQTTGELIGRASELSSIEAALERLDRGAGGVIELVGEPGIGKTRLLAEACGRADERRYLVLDGRASEFEREVPFDAFIDAMDDYVDSLDRRQLEAFVEDQADQLAGVFPALSSSAPAAPATLQDERFRSHHAVRRLLERLAARRPVVLALDDLHWADSASVELISHLLRRPPGAPVLLVLALRPHDPSPQLVAALEAAEREGLTERIEPTLLSAADAEALLGDQLEGEQRGRIYRASGGNPFYLEQLARAVRTDAKVARGLSGEPEGGAGDGLTDAPAAVTGALAAELEQLSAEGRALAEGAAIAGEPFEPELAAQAAGADPGSAPERLDELLEADLIRPTDVPRRFRFRHPIVRRAVYTSAKPGWRLAAHGRAAAALRERSAPPSTYAHHVERSAEVGDEQAAALLEEAGHATSGHAPAVAAHWFRAALRLLEETDENAQRRLELLVPMAMGLGAAGRLAEAREALREVLSLIPQELEAMRLQVLPFIALTNHLLGDHEAAPTLLRQALEELPDQDSLEAGTLELELGMSCFMVNDYDGLLSWARRAYETLGALSDPALQTEAAALFALAEYSCAELDAAAAHYAEASTLADSLDDGALGQRLRALFWLGWYGISVERYEEGIAYLERGLAVSRATGQGYLLVPMVIGIAIGRTWRGELAEAAALADDAIEMSRLSENKQSLTWSLTLRCWVATLAGDLGIALDAGEEAVEVAHAISDNYFSALSVCYLAETRLESGEHERSREELVAAAGGPELPSIERAFKAHFYEILTRAEIADARIEQAERWAALAEEANAGAELAGRVADASRARALLLHARGERDAPLESARASIAAAEQAGNRIDAARGRTLAGKVLGANGEREEAVSELERAREELAACGAARFADEAAQELRRLGKRVARRGRRGGGETGVAALSGRELEIAQLVAAGKTNKEIAAELYLSPKTIESHLSRVFEKLGVSKRIGVAGAIERERAAAAAAAAAKPG